MSENDSATTYIGITDVYVLQAWCRSVAPGYFVVEFSDSATTASIYKNHIIFPRPNTRMTLRDAIRMRGLMLHETSHPLYQPDYAEVIDLNKINMSSPLGMVFNVLLDCHAESCRGREYKGDAIALSEFGAVTARDVCERLVPSLTSPETLEKGLETNFLHISSVMVATITIEGTWNLGMKLGFPPLIAAMPQQVRDEASEIIVKFNLMARLLSDVETAASLWELSKEVYDFLWKKDGGKGLGEGEGKDQANESGNDKNKEKGKTSDEAKENGESDGESDGKQPSDDKADSGEQGGENSERGEGKDARTEDGSIPITELLFSNHYEIESKGNTDNAGGAGLHFDYSNYTSRDEYMPCDPSQVIVVNFDEEG